MNRFSKVRKASVLMSLVVSGAALAAPAASPSLEAQLKDLELPSNLAPSAIRQEKLYTVQNRLADLTGKSEIAVGGARNYGGNSFIDSTQLELAYRYHFTNRWNVAVQGAYGYNSLTDGGQVLLDQQRMVPDAAYVKYRGSVLATYNPFYGKFRLNMDRVMYFDQYVAVGPGFVKTQFQTAPALVADIGMAFWIGRQWSFRFGFQNEWYQEKRVLSTSREHHLLGHLNVGFAFGGGGT